MSHWVIKAKSASGLAFYLSERRGPPYGKKRREPTILEDAQVFTKRGSAANAAGQANYLPNYVLEVVPVYVGLELITS